MKLSIVIGNPKPASRTLKIADAVADRIIEYVGAERSFTVDLIDHATSLFEWPNADLAELSRKVADTDIILFGSPTYKASYTGLLKAFLDRYGNNALRGTVAVPIMTASSPRHAMAVEFTLRPLLVELGATVPTRGFFFNMQNMGELDEVVDNWASDNLPHLHMMRGARDLAGEAYRGPLPQVRTGVGSHCSRRGANDVLKLRTPERRLM